jgi:hypothetical protein
VLPSEGLFLLPLLSVTTPGPLGDYINPFRGQHPNNLTPFQEASSLKGVISSLPPHSF